MLEYYAELSVHTTKEELEQRINDYLLSDGYKRAKSKKNKRYLPPLRKGEFFTDRNSFEPDIEVGRWKEKIRLFYKYHPSVKIILYIWLSMCIVFQSLLLIEVFQVVNSFHIVMLIPTFMFLFGVLFSSLVLFITAKIRLGDLKRGIGYSGETKLKIKT